MKLNPDCVRDILKAVEAVTDYDHTFWYDRNDQCVDGLKSYSHEEILYHVRQCYSAGLIESWQPYEAGDSFQISDLSPAGHEFLANIRNDSVWRKIKGVAVNTCGGSLRGIAQIAQAVMTEIIKNQLGFG